MQMSSFELCNWLVISLLSFFVWGKDSDGCAAQRDLEQDVFGIYSINADGGELTVVNTWFETLVFFQFVVILSIKITKSDYFIGL